MIWFFLQDYYFILNFPCRKFYFINSKGYLPYNTYRTYLSNAPILLIHQKVNRATTLFWNNLILILAFKYNM